MKGLYNWVGFKKVVIEFDVDERLYGEIKWSFGVLLKLVIEGIIFYIMVFLKILMYFGFLVFFVVFIYMIYVLIKILIFGVDILGFFLLMIMILFLGGC